MSVMGFLAALLLLAVASPAPRPRARDLGVPFDGTPGAGNAITDVPGVTVGHETIIRGEGKLEAGKGPVRTGVTAIFPRGRDVDRPVPAAWFSLNGNGEMTGTAWIEESGQLSGPVLMTNTHSVGVVRDAALAWRIKQGPPDADGYYWSSLPVVGETWDGDLNDINGFHVKPENVARAIEASKPGPVAEGNVGGGTGSICFEFKGGIGTSSRKLPAKRGGYTVCALVQCNCGRRPQLTIAGVPVGREVPEQPAYGQDADETGSILIVVATDAPLLPHQLKRVAKRASMGLARLGAVSGNGSGDLFVAFSTSDPSWDKSKRLYTTSYLSNDDMDPIFEATVQATEEAIVNALVAAETMTGIDGKTVIALPHDRLKKALAKYNK
jgi:L-aminopeptidase/D-esterase-like protein